MTLVASDVQAAVRAAWQAYAEETSRVPRHDLDALEPAAWRRLKRRLRVIGEYVEYESR